MVTARINNITGCFWFEAVLDWTALVTLHRHPPTDTVRVEQYGPWTWMTFSKPINQCRTLSNDPAGNNEIIIVKTTLTNTKYIPYIPYYIEPKECTVFHSINPIYVPGSGRPIYRSGRPIYYGSDRIQILHGHFGGHWKNMLSNTYRYPTVVNSKKILLFNVQYNHSVKIIFLFETSFSLW